MSTRLTNSIRNRILGIAVSEKFKNTLYKELQTIEDKMNEIILSFFPNDVIEAYDKCKSYLSNKYHYISLDPKCCVDFGCSESIYSIVINLNKEGILSNQSILDVVSDRLNNKELFDLFCNTKNGWRCSYNEYNKQAMIILFGEELYNEFRDKCIEYSNSMNEEVVFRNKVSCTLSNLKTLKQLKEQIPNLYNLYINDLKTTPIKSPENTCDKAEEINAFLTPNNK